MRWPTSTDVTRIRQRHGNRSRFYLGVQRGKSRTSGCLASGAAGTFYVGCHYAINTVAGDAYDNAEHAFRFGNAGAVIDAGIRPGMTLAVGTLTDPFLYGSARIRYVDIANRRILVEPNNIFDEGYFANGDYIYCDGIYRLYRILPYINGGTVNEDGNADNGGAGWGLGDGIAWNANYNDRPVALMGSPRPAWTGENIDFYGWRSHGRGGRTLTHWTWDFDGGTCAGPGVGYPGSPSSPIHVSWATAGEYIASLTVRDNSGNAGADFYGVRYDEHVAVRPVLVYDRPGEGDNPPYTEFEVKSLRGPYGSGWSCSITVFGTADKSEFPDNALVILFCEDWYGGTQRQMGGWYGQENILFCGYIRSGSVTVNAETSSVTFEAQTIEQWMKEIDVWPANFASDPAANAWHEFVAMNCEDVLWHLAELHSTLKNVTDCFFASDIGTQKALGFLDLTEADLYNQMSDQLGSCFFGQLSATRHGSIHLSKHKNMLDLAERTVYGPPIWVFSKQDWRDDLEVGEERMRDSVAQVDFVGFIYDANGNPQDVYSLAPQRQTNFGRIEKVTGILLSGNTIAIAQPESNTLSGLYRAWKNIRFPHVRVSAFNNRFLEPATQDYFGLVLAASDTTRGYVWASKEFITTEVSYEINVKEGYLLVDVTGEASTWGPDGVAGEYPAVNPPDDFPGDNPSEYWPTMPAAADLPSWWPSAGADGEAEAYSKCSWQVGVCVIPSDGFYTTDDVTAAPPTWTQRNTGLAGDFLDVNDADVIADGNYTWLWLATDGGVARSTDYAANWTQLTLPDPTGGDTWASGNIKAWAIRVDPTDFDRVFAIIGDTSNQYMWVFRTQNARATTPTWDQYRVQVTNSGFTTWHAGDGPNELFVAYNGDVWFLAEDVYGGGLVLRAFRSVNHGASYTEFSPTSMPEDANSQINPNAGVRVSAFHYHHIYIFGRWSNTGTNQVERFRFSPDRGLTWQTRETGLPADVTPGANTRALLSVRQNPGNRLHLLGTIGTIDDLYETKNEGHSWSVVNISWGPFQSQCMEILRTNPNVIVAGTDSNLDAVRLVYSPDAGVTDQDKTSTLPARIVTQVLLPWKWW